MKPDISFIQKIVTGAGKIILRTRPTVREKKEWGGNWVTEADLASEQYILSQIHEKFSSHTILSEETHAIVQNPELEEHLWIVDPLDGTTNAKFGIPFFAISIAYCQRGVVTAGVIYDPNRNELFWAEKGKGAFLNDKQIVVQERKDFCDSLGNVGSPYSESDFQRTYSFGTIVHQNGGRVVNFGSGVLECAYVASGRLSLYFEAGLKPWDIAAGSLLIEEAGGTMASLAQSFSIFHQTEILVGNKEIVSRAKELLVPPERSRNAFY